MPDTELTDRIAALPCWSGPIALSPLAGGLTNRNLQVTDASGQRFVVRLGRDLPEHGVLRSYERAAARAAHAAGVAPEVVYAADGVLVSRFVDGQPLSAERVCDPQMLERIAALLRRAHQEIPQHLAGPTPMFWVFQVIRGYLRFLGTGGTGTDALAAWAPRATRLERDVGAVHLAFAHNDLLPGNLMDDGRRLWLIDWEYSGFNTPLFDLANLATNAGLDPELETLLLERYFGAPVDAAARRGFEALQCASLLRELLWAEVSARTSSIDFDYRGYGADYRERLERRWRTYQAQHG